MLLSVDRSNGDMQNSLSFQVVEAVAEQEGVDATEIEPPEYEALYDVLNPEALDALFAPREDGSPRSIGQVEFSFCGYDISVSSDGQVTLEE